MMNDRSVLCIDPGASGGMAWSLPNDLARCASMPDTPGQVLALIREIHAGARLSGQPLTCLMERVGGFVGSPQPGSAMFKFGEGYGLLQGILMAEGIPLDLVTPQAWQKALSLGTRGELSKVEWKRKLLVMAERLYPSVKVTLATADALLILHYFRARQQTPGRRPPSTADVITI